MKVKRLSANERKELLWRYPAKFVVIGTFLRHERPDFESLSRNSADCLEFFELNFLGISHDKNATKRFESYLTVKKNDFYISRAKSQI